MFWSFSCVCVFLVFWDFKICILFAWWVLLFFPLIFVWALKVLSVATYMCTLDLGFGLWKFWELFLCVLPQCLCVHACFGISIMFSLLFIYCFYLDFVVHVLFFLILFIELSLYEGLLVGIFLRVLFYNWFICTLFFWLDFSFFIKVLIHWGTNFFVRGRLFVLLFVDFLKAYMVFAFWIVFINVCLLFGNFVFWAVTLFCFWLFQSFAFPLIRHY